MSLKITVDGVSHPLNQHKTILENLESNNILAEFQCREGYCGACRIEKVSGEVSYEKEPIAFLRENEILPCYCKALSDITITI